MHPFVVITVGLGLVAFDLRTEVTDFAADPIGWSLVAYGAWRLAQSRPAWLAGLTAVLSLSELRLPYHWVDIDVETGERRELPPGSRRATHLVFDSLTGWRLALVLATTLAAGATLWLLIAGLEEQAKTRSPRGPTTQLRRLRMALISLWIVPQLLVIAASAFDGDGFDPVWNGNRSYLTLLALVPITLLALLLCLERGRAWATPEQGLTRPSPWSALRASASGKERSRP